MPRLSHRASYTARMSVRAFDPARLDVASFAKDAGELDGRWPLRQFSRIKDSIHAEKPINDGEEVAWSARGELREARSTQPQVWLHLKAAARLRLQCQRCLGPVELDVDIDRAFRFVAGEDAAAQMDADSDEDVLALTRALDLGELIEDELLLALPLVPRHDVCPAPLLAGDADGAQNQEGPNPFAVLAGFRPGGSSS